MPPKKERGRGRPPAAKETRSARVMVRLTQDEHDAFEAAAERDSRKIADWLRLQGLNAIARYPQK